MPILIYAVLWQGNSLSEIYDLLAYFFQVLYCVGEHKITNMSPNIIGEDDTQYQVTSDLPVYWVAIKAIESLDGLSISFRERRWQDRRHQQAAKKCLSCDLHKMPVKGYLPIHA